MIIGNARAMLATILIMPFFILCGISPSECKENKLKVPEYLKIFIPGGSEPSTAEIKDGYIVWNGKPFFRNLNHSWSLWEYKPVESIYQTYRYFLLCNTFSNGSARGNVRIIYEKGEKEALKDVLVNHRFMEANRLYKQKLLMSCYMNSLQYEIPNSLKGLTGDELYEKHAEYINGAAKKFASMWKYHPVIGGYEIFEEYWLPGRHENDFRPPKSKYVEWLRNKYGTVENLNSISGEKYGRFEDVVIPKERIDTRIAVLDYSDFLMEDNFRRIKIIRDAIKSEHPQMLVAGAKGEISRADWYYAPATDLFGWYCAIPKGYGMSNVLPRTAAEYFNKAFECIHVNYCRYAKRGEPWKEGEPFEENLWGIGYPHTITEIFEGMKQHWLEDYNDGSFHYFHPTKMIREKKEIKTWSGQKLYFHPEGLNGPDVMVPRSTLGMSRAFAWSHRAAPLFLPTKVVKGDVAVLSTDRSTNISNRSYNWRDTAQAFRKLQVSYGIVRDANLNEISNYKVLLAGSLARCSSKEFTNAVKKFISDGGKLILMPGAFTFNELNKATPQIRSEMEALACVRISGLPPYGRNYSPVDEPILFPNWDWKTSLEKYSDALKNAGVVSPVVLSPGAGDTSTELSAGVLKGNNYWLVGIASFDRSDRTVNVKMKFLPSGKYEVIDITGERPLIRKDKLAGFGLENDLENRYVKVLGESVSEMELFHDGVKGLKIQSGMARILLIRPAYQKVVVSCPSYEVRTIALGKVKVNIVVSMKQSNMVLNAANSLADAIKKQNQDVKIIDPADVKIKKTKFDAIVNPKGADYQYKIAVFENEPVKTDRNLIVIGSEDTNMLMKHFGKPGVFTYDKVLEKITLSYPGKGRGLIGIVESINDPSFDPTDQTRDALFIGGSDDEGTVAAIEKAKSIIAEK